MYVGAIIHARIGRVVFGAREPRAGALVSNLGLHEQLIYNHHFSIEEGVMAEECSTLMTAFFRNRRG
jgi:tRNA(adenine34) deaminase